MNHMGFGDVHSIHFVGTRGGGDGGVFTVAQKRSIRVVFKICV